jgi:hypothetical protein
MSFLPEPNRNIEKTGGVRIIDKYQIAYTMVIGSLNFCIFSYYSADTHQDGIFGFYKGSGSRWIKVSL